MQTFENLIYEFDSVLRTYNPIEYDKLKSPLTDKDIVRHLNELNIADESFKALFQWKNGEEDEAIVK